MCPVLSLATLEAAARAGVWSVGERGVSASLPIFWNHLAPAGADPLAIGVCLRLGELETVAEPLFSALIRLARHLGNREFQPQVGPSVCSRSVVVSERVGPRASGHPTSEPVLIS